MKKRLSKKVAGGASEWLRRSVLGMAAGVAGLFVTTGCEPPKAPSGRLYVVTTTTMVTELVERIGGEEVEVAGLMGPTVDPHLYKATAGDVSKLQKADIIFYSGHHLEGKMGALFERMSKAGRKVRAVTDAIPEDRLLAPPEFAGAADPHVWFDPRLWAECALIVGDDFAASDPEHAADYRERATRVRAEILALHDWAVARVEELAPERRILITSHDAYNYFGRAYGFTVVGVQGISTVTEAGLADIAKTTEYIRDNGVKAIFVESSVSPAAIERISRDSGAVIGGELFSDAMGAPGEIQAAHGESYDLGSYEGMVKHNVNHIVDALK